jgi:hypothetical protein
LSDKGDSGLENQHEEADLARVDGDDGTWQQAEQAQQSRQEQTQAEQAQAEQAQAGQSGDQEIGSMVRVGHQRLKLTFISILTITDAPAFFLFPVRTKV